MAWSEPLGMAKGCAEGCDRVEARATGSRRGRGCVGETNFAFLGQQGEGQGGDKVTARPWPWQAHMTAVMHHA